MKTSRCSIHPDTRAAWQCSKCGGLLCPRCAASDTIQNLPIIRCLSCGGVAGPLMVRRQVKPFWWMFLEFFKAIFSLRGLFHLVALGFMLRLVAFSVLVPLIGWIAYAFMYFGIYATYYFMVIREAASGNARLPTFERFIENLGEMFYPALRFIAAAAVVWIPLLLYIQHYGWARVAALGYTGVLQDPVLLVIAIVGLLYFPAAIITAAISESTLSMLNPLVILGIIVRVPRDYLLAVFFWGVFAVGRLFLQNWLTAQLFSGVTFSFTALFAKLWLVESVTLVLPVLTAFILGWMIFQNGEVLGVIKSNELLEPEYPQARPLGSLPEGGFQQQKPKKVAQNIEPIALDEAPEGDPMERLREALAGETSERVMEAYRRVAAASLTPDLDPQLELRLASLLDRNGDSMEAVLACRRAAEKNLRGPLAARAVFTAARLMVERVGNRDDGLTLYRYLLDNFPNDELAPKAREAIERLTR